MEILIAHLGHLDSIVTLFDAYRQFYKQESNIVQARVFIEERLKLGDSTILIAIESENSHVVGFTQLYPSFTSIGMSRVYILNDLFVAPSHRKMGVATLLLQAAKKYAHDRNVIKIVLETAHDNITAKKLYESEGYTQDSSEFDNYSLNLKNNSLE